MIDGKQIGHAYEMRPYEPSPGTPASPRTQIEYGDFEPADETHLRDYLHVILRRKWFILVFFLVIVVSVTLSSFLMKPIYKSTAVVRIDKENPNVLAFKDVQLVTPDEDYYATQYKILKSRSLAKKTIQMLALDKDPDFNPGLKKGFFSSVKATLTGVIPFFGRPGGNPQSETTDEQYGYLVDRFTGMQEVVPIQKSQLVQLSFLSPNPALAQKVANGMAAAYIDFNIDSGLDASQNAGKFLEKQLDILKSKLESSEVTLNKYSSDNEMLFIDENHERQSILNQKLTEISTALNTATTGRIQAEALFREIRESGPENPVIMNNPLIHELKKEYASLESEYSNLSKLYKPEFPKMKRLQTQMDAVSNRIAEEKRSLAKAVESDYSAALKKEKYLAGEFDNNKRKMLDFQKRNIQYQILKRDVDANRELYTSLLQRMKEISVSATKTTTNIQILDAAEYPKKPFKPDKSRNILLAAVFGLLGGIGLAFFIEYFDNTIKDTGEIEKRLRLPTLGLIPHQRLPESVKRPLLAYSKNRGAVAEAFRSIGTFILLSSAARPPKTILVTSPGEREGKTTICINTAMALAESIGNGVIIDADLRKPKLNHCFDVENETGLTTYLSGNMEFEGSLIKKTAINGLSIITSGPVPPNPSELIVSKRMKDLIDGLQSLFDFIIIDSVPVMGIPDSIYLSSIVDGSVIVIKAGETSRNALMETKKIFRSINSKILGVIINGIRENDLKYNYYSNYYSSYFKEQA